MFAGKNDKNMNNPRRNNKVVLFCIATAIVLLVIYLIFRFDYGIRELLNTHMGLASRAGTIVGVLRLVSFAILAYLLVRALNAFIFGLVRFRRGFEAPTLVRNIFSIVAFTALFFLIFTLIFPNANLGAVFTTSAIFGVILGLALQDTLGNFFAGISLQADRPFQVGDVITVGSERHTGVVEEITWRAVKIRTLQSHIVLISNSTAGKESIEVCPRENLNARLVFFNTVFTDSPAKAIHVVREAVREADNVSPKVAPIVRVRDIGDSAMEYEVKYWLIDYAQCKDTDPVVRQRIWYAFRRAGLTFAVPTRTLVVARKARAGAADSDGGAIVERLAAVGFVGPLSLG